MGIINNLMWKLGYLNERDLSVMSKANRVYAGLSSWDKEPKSKFSSMNSYLNAAKQITWVYKAVSMIAQSIATTRYSVKDRTGKVVENTGDLAGLLERPNTTQDWFEFVEGLVWYLLLAGNNYIAKEEVDGKGRPKQLYLVRPDRMQVVPGSDGPQGYVYDVNTKKIPYERTEIIHSKLFNPLDDWYGMGKIEANVTTMDIDIKSNKYNSLFFDNGAKPSGTLTAKEALTPEVFNRVKEQFKAEHKGLMRMNKTLVLEQGMTYQQMGLTQKDMDFISLRKMTREEICSIFGIPPAKAGLLENSNRSTSKEDDYTYQSETITPLLRRIQGKLTQELVQLYNPGWRFAFENVVVRDESAESTTAKTYFDMGAITPNEVRKLFMQMDVIDDPSMDLTYVPLNLVPVKDAGTAQPEPQAPSPAPTPAPEPKPAKGVRECNCNHDELPGEKKLSVRQVIYRQSVTSRKRVGKTTKKIMTKFFDEQCKRVIEKLKSKALPLTGTKDLTGDIFNSAFEDGELQKAARRFHTSQMSVTIDALNDILDLNIDNSTANPTIALGLTKLAQKVTKINDTTKGAIEKVCNDGIANGSTIDEIAANIQDVFDGATGYRAEMIARTETARAWDAASIESYKEYGATFVDCIGCTGTDDYPESNCNRPNIPIAEADSLEWHPNHTGCLVPQI